MVPATAGNQISFRNNDSADRPARASEIARRMRLPARDGMYSAMPAADSDIRRESASNDDSSASYR